MSDAENQNQQPGISLRKSIGIYTAFVLVFSVMMKLTLTTTWFPGIIAFVTYVAFGFALNRVVLRGLIEWHPMYNTIGNVTSAKLSSFALWPLSYASLFFKLAVNKVLQQMLRASLSERGLCPLSDRPSNCTLYGALTA